MPTSKLPKDILAYNAAQSANDKRICDALAKAIDASFAKLDGAEAKIWHRHPVWFLDGNPIVGYHKLKGDAPKASKKRKTNKKTASKGDKDTVNTDDAKDNGCIRLLFWSGQSFDEPDLFPEPADTKFQTAGARFTSPTDIPAKDLKRWLKKSADIQWDYKNIVKRKGKLLRLK